MSSSPPRVDIPDSFEQGGLSGSNLRGTGREAQGGRSRGPRVPRRLRWPRPVGLRPVASSARRQRCGEPGGLSWPRRALGRPWRAPANQTRGSGAAPKPRRRAARGARSRGGTESGGRQGRPELRRGTAPAGGRRAGLPGAGVPAMCGAEAASGAAAAAAAAGSASASRRCRRRRRRRRLLLRTWQAQA